MGGAIRGEYDDVTGALAPPDSILADDDLEESVESAFRIVESAAHFGLLHLHLRVIQIKSIQ